MVTNRVSPNVFKRYNLMKNKIGYGTIFNSELTVLVIFSDPIGLMVVVKLCIKKNDLIIYIHKRKT